MPVWAVITAIGYTLAFYGGLRQGKIRYFLAESGKGENICLRRLCEFKMFMG